MSVRSQSSYRLAERTRVARALGVGLVLFAVSWALLHSWFWADYQIVDTPLYEEYGRRMLDGQVPYRDFALEYPPGALPVFLLPELVAPESYGAAFEMLMWICGVAALFLVVLALAGVGASSSRLIGAAAFVGLGPLALGALVMTRFDLWPAALTVGALAAFAWGRERLGAGVLALAVGAKLYPLVLLPIVVVWIARRRGARAAAVAVAVFAAVLLAIFLPFLALSPGGVVDSFTRQLGRPLQIESLGASVLLAAHQLGWYEPTVVHSHGSQNLSGGLPDALATAQTVLGALALAVAWVLFARLRDDGERLLLGAAAALVAFVAFGKVLSPQFLIWLVPLVPLVAGSAGLAACLLLAVALVLTQGFFPHRYWDMVALEPIGWLVLFRNLFLVAVFAVLLVAIARARGTPRSS